MFCRRDQDKEVSKTMDEFEQRFEEINEENKELKEYIQELTNTHVVSMKLDCSMFILILFTIS